jgi:hypothetical protein
MRAKCPACNQWFDLHRAHVRDRGDTGYEITCDDFRQLLRHHMSAADVESYVAGPLGFRAYGIVTVAWFMFFYGFSWFTTSGW